MNAVLDEITDALAAGNRVELRGFGAFSVKNRPSRSGRNPRTGETVFVEEKWVPFFKTGKELRERLTPIWWTKKTATECRRSPVTTIRGRLVPSP